MFYRRDSEEKVLCVLKLLPFLTESTKPDPGLLLMFSYAKKHNWHIDKPVLLGTELAAQAATHEISCAREIISGSFKVFM